MNPHLTISAMPATRSGRGQRRQGVEVAEHAGRRVERADQVLALGGVDPGLPTDGGVDHREQRRRDLDDPDPAQPGRRDEPREVGHRAATDADDRVGPGEPGLPERAPELGGDDGALGLLRVRDHGEVRVEPGGARGVGHLLRPHRQRRRVDDEDALHRLAQQRHDGVDDPVADDDLVRVVAGSRRGCS